MEAIGEEQQQIILEFVSESLETLDSVEPILIDLSSVDQAEVIKETIDLIFRPFHSLKGGAGFLNLMTIQKITHTAETLLQHFRTDADLWEPRYAEVLVYSCDLLRKMLQQVESQFQDEGFDEEASALIENLEEHLADFTEDQNQEKATQIPISSEGGGSNPEVMPLTEVLTQSANFLQNLVQHHWELFDKKKAYLEVKTLIEALEYQAEFEDDDDADDLFFLPNDPNARPKLAPEPEPPPLPPKPKPAKVDYNIPKEQMKLFVEEVLEHLEAAEGAFLVLDKLGEEVDTQEYLQSAFRSFHTIKGNAGFLFLKPMEDLSHKAESLLDAIQKKKSPASGENVQKILETIDVLREGTMALSRDEELDFERFEKAEAWFSEEGGEKKIEAESAQEEAPAPPKPTETIEAPEPEASKTEEAKTVIQPAEVVKPPSQSPPAPTPPPQKQTSPRSALPIRAQDIRVNLYKMDKLIDLVGELVISEAMISHHPDLERVELEGLKNATGQLHRNMRELQEVAMSMRMMPISSLFRKMVRVVHDVSKKLEKNTTLKLLGEDTEVDKTVIEQVTDPLLHIIRNAVDHGLEIPAERVISGKLENGTIQLEARHVGNEVWIIIEDDGRGMNRENILAKAKAKGLIADDTDLPDEDVWKLVLEPGFSTSEVVTDFSGRGVGMDVVKKNIEKLRGTVDIRSQAGKGSTVTLRIPLTLSIIDGLLVRVGDVSYALPTVSIKETLKPEMRNVKRMMDGSEVLRLRDRLIPIVRLHKLYYTQPDSDVLANGMLLVIDQSTQLFCLFVDAVLGQQQVVVKGLPKSMNNVPHLAGCTILGNGQVGLILDASSLANIVSKSKNESK